MLQPHLSSRVGRRLFIRFLMAALLPIGGLAWFAYQTVGQILVEAAHHQLTRDGKGYGMSLVEDLNRYAQVLRRAAVEGPSASPEPVMDGAAWRWTDEAPVVAPADDRVTLRFVDGHPELSMAAAAGGPWLVARLESGRFWNNDSAPEHFCVFSLDGAALVCSAGLAGIGDARIPEAHRDQNASVSEQSLAGTDYLLGFWRARYLTALDSPGFIVMVATPRAVALEDLARFRVAFPAVVVLAVALAAWLSSGQIRQQMAPLVRLQDSTRRLAEGELQARVGLTGNDEFAQLGQAFDRMATHLQSKFHMLGLLSELDRAILGSSERTEVIQTMLGHIHEAIDCDGAGLLEFHESGNGEWLAADAGISGGSVLSVPVEAAQMPPPPNDSGWSTWPVEALPATVLASLQSGGRTISHVLAFPAYFNHRLDSVLLLAFAHSPHEQEAITQAGRSLADRLAVAAAGLAREQMLYQQAHYDALTRLPNRLLLRDRIEQAIAHSNRTDTSAALLFIDLDGFKQVNDTLGHARGDALLEEYARRLRQRMRESDTVARLGGDEFVVLIPDLAPHTAYATADRMARDLSRLLSEPFQLAGQSVVSPASIGIALYPDNASSHEELLKRADAAMYESKRRNSGGYCFYTSHISAQTRDRFELTQELRDAIQRRELLLHYQPKVDARSGRLAGAEALLRWRSPKRGLVMPGVFVNLIDEMGLGTWLGEWVLGEACAQMRAWDQAGFAPFPVSINFSPLQFERTPVVERVREALQAHQLAPARLELEILESMAANESPGVRQSLIALRELGVAVSLDDFGTGFSSLVHLTQVPADIIKLDRVFIHSLCDEPRQREVVELIIAMAKVMHLKVVAEGVETEAQRALLPGLGCDLLQGYLVGRPVAPEAFAARWLESPATA